MGSTSYTQNSFLGGEWGPFAQGKSNTEEYYSGMNLCLNYLPTDEGALTRRGGFRFSAEARANDVRLIEFLTAAGDSLICEITAGKLRFHVDGGLHYALATVGVTSFSSGTPTVVTTDSAHGWATGDTVIFPTVSAGSAPYLFNRQFRITVLSPTTFSMAHTGSLGTGSVDGSTLSTVALADERVAKVTEKTVPYTAAQLADIKFAEEQNNLYLFHAAHEPIVLDGGALTVSELDNQDGPYFDENTTSTTLAFSGTSGSVTVTASSTTGINNGAGFQTTDVGRRVRINSGTATEPNWSWGVITARASTTSVTFLIRGPNLASGSANTKWRLGLFSDTTGWPTAGVIHEGRLWLASDVVPGRVDSSKAFDFANFAPTDQDGDVADDSAVSLLFAGAGRKNLQWLVSAENGLLVGADSSEWLVRASVLDDPITPFTVQVRQVTNFGSADIQAVRAGRNTIFVQALGRALMEYKQVERARDGVYDGNDLARNARHLTAAGIAEIRYAKVPVPVVWMRRTDGRLIGCTYRDDAEGRQVAWHQHNVAWADDPFDATEVAAGRHLYENETGPIVSIAAAPFSDPLNTRNDTLWAAIDRNGVVCVEYMTPVFDDTREPHDAHHVDSGGQYTAADFGVTWIKVDDHTYRFYGFDRLVGDNVDLQFRGVDMGFGTVASGGYVDVTVPESLDVSAAGCDLSERSEIVQGTLTFNSGHLSDFPDGGSSSTRPHDAPPNSSFLLGEDGKRYIIKTRGGSATLALWDVDNGVDGPSKAVADIWTDVVAAYPAGPGGSWNGSGGPGAGLIIPGTPYILFFAVAAFGTTTDRYVAYYRINSSGEFAFVGMYATGDGTLNVQFSPDQDNEAFGMAGHMFANRSSSSSGHYAEEYPILVGYHGEGRSSLCVIPSIQYVKTNTPVVTSGSSLWKNNHEKDLAGVSFGGVSMQGVLEVNGYIGNNTSAGFFLPATAGPGGSRAYFVWHPLDVDEHVAGTASPAAPWLSTYAPAHPGGFISSVRCRLDAADNLGTTSSISNARVSDNAQFEGVAYPFPDIGENYDGSAGTKAHNFYLAPAVFPVDNSQPFGDWVVLFPRLYRKPGDTDKFGVRVYKFSPRTQKFTHMGFTKGKLFDYVADGVPTSFVPEFCSLYWDHGTGEIFVYASSENGSPDVGLVAKFGTFEPSTEALVAEACVEGVIGLNYRSRAQLLRPDFNSGARNGPGLGKRRRTDRFNCLFYRTGQISFGTNFADTIPLVLSDPDTYGRRPLFSGVSPIRGLQDTYTYDSMLCWEQARPDPGAIVAAVGHMSTQDL